MHKYLYKAGFLRNVNLPADNEPLIEILLNLFDIIHWKPETYDSASSIVEDKEYEEEIKGEKD